MAKSYLSPRNNTDTIKKICILGDLRGLVDDVIKTAQDFNLEIEKSDTPEKHEGEKGVLLITENFHSTSFEKLRSHYILGPVAFLQIVQRFGKIPKKSTQPVYCLALFQKKICLSGFKKPQQIYLKNLINFMGGSVKPEVRNDISYLITSSKSNEQYEKAVELNIPVWRTQWVLDIWNQRDNFKLNIFDPVFESLSVTELSVVHISFCGFCKEEAKKLEEKAFNLGITVVNITCDLCTHVVINPERPPIKPLPQENLESSCAVVVLQWFTLVCRMKIPVSVNNYRFIRPENLKKRNSGSLKRRFSHPRRSSQSEDVCENLETAPAVDVKTDSPLSDDDEAENRIPAKTCRVQLYTEFCKADQPKNENLLNKERHNELFLKTHHEQLRTKGTQKVTEESQPKTDAKPSEEVPLDKLKKMCERRKFKCIELYETEKNYVDIMNAVNKIFKLPLEQALLENRPLISELDIKVIFQKFSPILKVHERILQDLEPLIKNWNDDCAIGNIFVNNNSELNKAYPQFINFMDVILHTIEDLSNSNAEFQKFLKEAESNPACHRQGLKDLIVWPMQRIGRLILLLQGILKDTAMAHMDYQPLRTAIEMMENCGRLVNEDKRITENIVNKLGMFYEIENCPHEFLSMKEIFIAKYVVLEVETTFRKPATFVLLLFKEFLEICKQRSRNNKISGLIQKKLPYKHVNLLPLEQIKAVALVTTPKEHTNKFAIMVQPLNESSYRSVYSVQSGTAEELVQNLAITTAKHSLCNADEIKRDLSYEQVINFFTHQETLKKQAIASTDSPNTNSSTPVKFVENDKSPSSKSLPASNKKGKLRRAFSSFLTPIQNIVASTSPATELKSGISSSSITSLDPSVAVENTTTTPKLRKKLKSNSFGVKSTHSKLI